MRVLSRFLKNTYAYMVFFSGFIWNTHAFDIYFGCIEHIRTHLEHIWFFSVFYWNQNIA